MLVRPTVKATVPQVIGPEGTGLPWESGGGGVAVSAPVNTVAPSIAGTAGSGLVLTGTAGTWTGTPTPTLTYVWQRGDALAGTGTFADLADTDLSYTQVNADVCYSVRLKETATNAAGSAVAYSNAILYNPTTALPDTAIGVNRNPAGNGITTADLGTTVDRWLPTLGGKTAIIIPDAPAATNRPAYSATGGPNSQPLVTFDGVDNVLRDAVTGAWGFGPAAGQYDVIGFVAGAETGGDILMRYTGTTAISLNSNSTPVARLTTTVITSTGTTTITATHRQMSGAWITGASGTQNVKINNGAAEATDATTAVAQTDAGIFSIGASQTGTTPTALSCIGWAITEIGTAAAALSAQQLTDLRALFQNYCGVA